MWHLGTIGFQTRGRPLDGQEVPVLTQEIVIASKTERMIEVARDRLGDAKLVIVANREPYIHQYADEGIRCMKPASGLTTALDPVMEPAVVSGLLTAAVMPTGRLPMPMIESGFLLRTIVHVASSLAVGKEEAGLLLRFCQRGLWPLCHAAYMRPKFDPGDWAQYRLVNQKFAEAVLEEAADEPAIVFIQDYHFALLPRMLKKANPRLVVVQFWHIPWPNREVFAFALAGVKSSTACWATTYCRFILSITATTSWIRSTVVSKPGSTWSTCRHPGRHPDNCATVPDKHRLWMR